MTQWVSEWGTLPASPPVCSCCLASAPSSLTEPHKRQMQLSSVTSIPKFDGLVFLMEKVTWNDFYGPKLHTHFCLSLILHWDPLDWGKSPFKYISPLSTFLWHPGSWISIRLLPSSCLNMYGNPGAQPQYDQWAVLEATSKIWRERHRETGHKNILSNCVLCVSL